MAHYLAAVQTDPVECRVREVVDVVPAQLLRKEACHAGETADLWQLAGVAESIRQPEGVAALAKMRFEEPLAIDELANQGFTGRHIRIVFNPSTTNEVEFSFQNFFPYALKKSRIELPAKVGFNNEYAVVNALPYLFKPFVLLCLTTGEPVFRVTVHKIDLSRPRPCNFLLSNAVGP